jgi:hypothetical protein
MNQKIAPVKIGAQDESMAMGVRDARMPAKMPSYILACESCGSRRSFIVYEEELEELHKSNALIRQCPVCRASTNWKSGFPERRSGRDKRQGGDRRTSKT